MASIDITKGLSLGSAEISRFSPVTVQYVTQRIHLSFISSYIQIYLIHMFINDFNIGRGITLLIELLSLFVSKAYKLKLTIIL